VKRAMYTVVLTVLLVGILTVGDAHAAVDCASPPPIGAHRGAPLLGSGHTENGMPAFNAAWSRPEVSYVETDFRRTKDHQILIMHDRTLDRTTNGTGFLAQITYAKATSYRLDDGSRIPGEKTFLNALRASGKGADMELKDLGPMAMQLFASILNNYRDLASRIDITSLSTSQLALFRSYAGTTWRTELIGTTVDQASAALAYGPEVQAFHPADVAGLVSAGLLVEAGATGPDQWTTVTASPLTRILTNDTKGLQSWLVASCSGTPPTNTAKNYSYNTAQTD
jgi:glycerophosphoryl diester phosphodiesterase